MIGELRRNLLREHFLDLQILGNEGFLCIKETPSNNGQSVYKQEWAPHGSGLQNGKFVGKNPKKCRKWVMMCGHRFCKPIKEIQRAGVVS